MTVNRGKNSILPEPPKELYGKIVKRISKEERFLLMKKRLAAAFLVMLGSGAMLFPAFNAVRTGMAESGFLEFLSLIFSDFKSVLAFWQSFSWALLESFPATSFAGFLAAILVFLGALKYITQDLKIALSTIKYKAV